MTDLYENPIGTNGFDFVEYCCEDFSVLDRLFKQFGFVALAKHHSKNVILYQQGDIKFLLNAEKQGHVAEFVKEHNAGACSMGFRVNNAEEALQKAVERGAEQVTDHGGSMEHVPAIKGIGGSLIYFIEKDEDFDEGFYPVGMPTEGYGLTYIDHLTHNVHRGNMNVWAEFYEKIFNFREVRYFDIEGKLTGLVSKAMTSPCGGIRIPLNESTDDKSQIEEFLERFNGEGIQHIALGTDNIYETVHKLRKAGLLFQDPPDAYYRKVDERVPEHGEDLARLKELRILIDGAPTEGQGILLQIFTQETLGPVFFEIIQRKGNEGFGEGNFQALFESIEQDQVRRGVLSEEDEE